MNETQQTKPQERSVQISIPTGPAHEHPAFFDTVVGGIVVAALSVVATLLWLRKAFYRDNRAIDEGKAESRLMTTLITQAEVYKEDARLAWGQRTQDAQMIARQQAELRNLREHLDMMQRVLTEVAPERAELFDSLPKYHEQDSSVERSSDDRDR